MANLTGTYDPQAEAQADLGKLPTGEYIAQIVDSDMKPAKNGGEYLALTYEVMDGPYAGRKHFENINLGNPNPQVVEIANRQFASIREATGVINPRDSQELHYKPHVIRIEFYAAGSTITGGKKKGLPREYDDATIKAWKKLDSDAPVQAAQSTPAAAAPAQSPWGTPKAA